MSRRAIELQSLILRVATDAIARRTEPSSLLSLKAFADITKDSQTHVWSFTSRYRSFASAERAVSAAPRTSFLHGSLSAPFNTSSFFKRHEPTPWMMVSLSRRWSRPFGRKFSAETERKGSGALTLQRVIEALRKPSSLQRAASLQLESAWQRHRAKIFLGGIVLMVYWVWRGMRATAAKFVDVSDSLAATGVFALSASLSAAAVTFAYRRYFSISPAAAYRMAMVKLNSHPGLLEIMGAPVVGSNARASVMTGGGIKFKGSLRPRLRSRRIQMIFPLKGTERRGLVSLEAKKRAGKLKLSLLAVDVPMPAVLGGEQRVYLEGGPKAYSRGGVLDELRRPFLSAIASDDQAEEADEAEEEEEKRRERFEQGLLKE